MHPLLAAGFTNAILGDRQPAALRRVVRRGADTAGHAEPDDGAHGRGSVVIRRGTTADRPALVRTS